MEEVVGDAVTIKKISRASFYFGIDLELIDDDAVSAGQYVPYLIVLVVVLCLRRWLATLMRARSLNPSPSLTHYVRQQMDKTPGSTQGHELVELQEALEGFVRYKKEVQVKLLQQSTLAAIGRTAQMLAHDVRKPFAMVQSLVHLTRNAKDLATAYAQLHKFVPEIEKAFLSVEGLIRDIMEVDSNKKPDKEFVHLSSLIRNSVYDAFRIHARHDIRFRYALNHRHALHADPLKASRVFSNIIANAIEAMHDAGELWFETREITDRSPPMIEIAIGNSGSFIPEQKREQIFDAFFTEGKHSGTGLGLAIVRKLVTDHGGDVCCRSSEATGTEFVLTLPMTDVVSEYDAEDLPASSDSIVADFQTVGSQRHEPSIVPTSETKLAERIIEITRQLDKPMNVLVADDEALYQRVLESHVEPSLKPHVQLVFADSAEKALEILAEGRFDLVIMDVNFGKDKLSGFEAVKRLRDNGNLVNVCIHSSHGVLEYQGRGQSKQARMCLCSSR